MSTLVVLLAAEALAGPNVTSELGSDQQTSWDADYCYKLNVVAPNQTVRLLTISPWVAYELGHDGIDRLHYVVYEESSPGSNDWELVWDSGLVGPIGTSMSSKDSPTVDLLLEDGKRYAVGFLLEDGNYVYQYEDPGTVDNLTWATFEGSVWTAGDALQFSPDPIPDEIQNFDPAGSDQAYHMELTVELLDEDGDGVIAGEDCDDDDAARYPGADEYCDGIDNDCSGTVDDNLVYRDAHDDADGDGYGDASAVVQYCEPTLPEGLVASGDDCDDGDASQHPGAAEVCNGEDDDCDTEIDEGLPRTTYWADADGDGAGDALQPIEWCGPVPGTAAANADDCDDTNAARFPGNEEVCDGVDNDCDELAPDEDDADGDGALACEDCGPDDPTIWPGAPETCDGVDHDCDGHAPPPIACDPAPVEGLRTLSACGCASGPSGGAPLLAPIALLAFARRRRRR